MKFKTRIEHMMIITKDGNEIRLDFTEEAPYHLEFDLLDEDKEKVRLDSEQLNLKQKNICLDCIHSKKVFADQYPCVRCVYNPCEYNNPNLKKETDLFHINRKK